METIANIDKQLFLAINGAHNAFFDFIMFWLSDKLIWIPLYAWFIYLYVSSFGWRKAVWLILFSGIVIAASDQGSVHLFKNMFQRLRPCHDPELQGIVHLVNDKCGGKYSFVSSHAANHFAITTFVSVILGNKVRYLTPVLFVWAVMIGYSRIYLGVHYPGDVLGGATYGFLIGFLIGSAAKISILKDNSEVG